jgi:hypothetical protein
LDEGAADAESVEPDEAVVLLEPELLDVELLESGELLFDSFDESFDAGAFASVPAAPFFA